MSLSTIGETVPRSCYMHSGGEGVGLGSGTTCGVCTGVGRGLGDVGEGWIRIAEEGERWVSVSSMLRCSRCVDRGRQCCASSVWARGLSCELEAISVTLKADKTQASETLLTSVEALKTQRDLYVAFRDLFVRHDRKSHFCEDFS